MQGVKIATIEFPHLYVIFHCIEELEELQACFKLGDEQCLQTGNTIPEMNEICLQLCNRTFAMTINGHKMGHIHDTKQNIPYNKNNIPYICCICLPIYMEIVHLPKVDDGQVSFGMSLQDKLKVDIV